MCVSLGSGRVLADVSGLAETASVGTICGVPQIDLRQTHNNKGLRNA